MHQQDGEVDLCSMGFLTAQLGACGMTKNWYAGHVGAEIRATLPWFRSASTSHGYRYY